MSDDGTGAGAHVGGSAGGAVRSRRLRRAEGGCRSDRGAVRPLRGKGPDDAGRAASVEHSGVFQSAGDFVQRRFWRVGRLNLERGGIGTRRVDGGV